jgi:Transposase DDE domain group 1
MVGSPATKTSTTLSRSPAIRRCGQLSAGRVSIGRRRRSARWAASRPSGRRARRTSRPLRISPAPGSTGCTSVSPGRHHPGPGQLREPDLRRSGGLRLQRPLPLFVLPPVAPLQSVRRPGALPPAAGQRPRRGRLAHGPGAGDRPLPERAIDLYLHADAAFAKPELYEALEAEDGQVRHSPAGEPAVVGADWPSLTRPVGRPPNKPQVFFAGFSYQAQSWARPRRVVAKVEWHQGELYPRLGFLVTNLKRPAEWVVKFYNGRGTAEQWIRQEGRAALDAALVPRFPGECGAPAALRAGLQPGQLPAHARLAGGGGAVVADHPARELVKISARIARHGRYVVFQLAAVAVPRALFRRDPAPDRPAAGGASASGMM